MCWGPGAGGRDKSCNGIGVVMMRYLFNDTVHAADLDFYSTQWPDGKSIFIHQVWPYAALAGSSSSGGGGGGGGAGNNGNSTTATTNYTAAADHFFQKSMDGFIWGPY
jgi:hypothetical protein